MENRILDRRGFNTETTLNNSMRVAKSIRLIGQGYVGASLDANYFTATPYNGGTVSQANAIGTIATGTTANGGASVISTTEAIFNSVSPNRYRSFKRVSTTNVANNVKVRGALQGFAVVSGSAPTYSNGFGFEYIGNLTYVIMVNNGVKTVVLSSSWNKKPGRTMDIGWHEYEIERCNGWTVWMIDGDIVHEEKLVGRDRTVAGSLNQELLSGRFQLPMIAANVNLGGATTNSSLLSVAPAIFRLGEIDSVPLYKNITTAGTFTLKNNAGILKAITVNSTNGTLCTIYDSTTGAGTTIGSIALNQIFTRQPDGGVFFNNGLTLVTTGASLDITVIRE